MKKAKLISYEYIYSDQKRFQGNYQKLCREFDKGWEVANGSNGSYILAKPAMALFTFRVGNKKYEYNMRNDILKFVNNENLSEKAFETFKDKIEDGTITVYIDEDGYYRLEIA